MEEVIFPQHNHKGRWTQLKLCFCVWTKETRVKLHHWRRGCFLCICASFRVNWCHHSPSVYWRVRDKKTSALLLWRRVFGSSFVSWEWTRLIGQERVGLDGVIEVGLGGKLFKVLGEVESSLSVGFCWKSLGLR